MTQEAKRPNFTDEELKTFFGTKGEWGWPARDLVEDLLDARARIKALESLSSSQEEARKL